MGPFRDRKRWKSAKPKVERDRTGRTPAAFALLRALIILMFGGLVLQLINLQVIRGDEFKERAEINALREVPLPSARGLIADRNGQPLVQNSARFSAASCPATFPIVAR
jgi:penicillin-binding protein 2